MKVLALLITILSVMVAEEINPNRFVRSGESKQGLISMAPSVSGLPYPYKYVREQSLKDTVKVIAFRVEFQPDKDLNTTGNGRFGIASKSDTMNTYKDLRELSWYESGVYKYDRLPHDSVYIAQKLDHLVEYYDTVSRGNLTIEYEIFPRGKTERDAYKLPLKMALYSPGNKRDVETYNEFNLRSTKSLMAFYRDAILAADSGFTASDTVESPFESIDMDENGTLWEVDSLGVPFRKVVFLVIHAGASGILDPMSDSPSDVLDNFMTENFIDLYYRTDPELFNNRVEQRNGKWGFSFSGYGDSTYILSDMMMISETSTQDSVNYGTHGILVNQFARQIGVPDLYSRSSASTGVGRFGIMDFQGYSAGNGFIPPFPSAWTRLFMGWDKVRVVSPGESYSLPAVGSGEDTTVALVALNNREYWLLENRQRNLTEDATLFSYDTVDGKLYIDSDSAINFDNVVSELSPEYGVILNTKSRDIGLPASGIAVWHVDEGVIDQMIENNLINSDSSYRGVSLEEADGVEDLGTFVETYWGNIYDYGGAEDLFPHRNDYLSTNNATEIISEFSPITSPATKSNSGGNSFISLEFSPDFASTERYYFRRAADEDNKYHKYFVDNCVADSLSFSVSITTEQAVTPSKNWPIRSPKGKYYDPILSSFSDREFLFSYDSSGRVLVADMNGDIVTDSTLFEVEGSDTLFYTTKFNSVYTFATKVGNSIAVPTTTGSVFFITDVLQNSIEISEVSTGTNLSTPIVGSSNSIWYCGTKSGSLVMGNGLNIDTLLNLEDSSVINALSLLNNTLFSISENGIVSAIENLNSVSFDLKNVSSKKIYSPFTMVSGDLNGDDIVEVVIVDSKQSLMLLQYDTSQKKLYAHPQTAFQRFPNDWPSIFNNEKNRDDLPVNGATPSLSDIDGDGTIEILVPGTNGVFAFSHLGVQLPDWPIILDRVNWYYRRSVYGSPITVKDNNDETVTLFSTPTGENITYEVTKVDSTGIDHHSKGKYVAYVTSSNGFVDSLIELDSLYLFDTLLVQEDSLLFLNIMPGGLIEGRNMKGNRPDTTITTSTVGKRSFSSWPLSVGAPVLNAPVYWKSSDGTQSLFAINSEGYIHKWDLSSELFSSSEWPITGGSVYRTFSRSGSDNENSSGTELEYFYSFPNPVRVIDGDEFVTFRYKLSNNASKVNLSIFTTDGHTILDRDIGTERGINEFVLSDLSNLGSAVYNCRLDAQFDGTEKVQFWKMVIMRGQK